jgi:DNA-binding LacI/PurR family transcriptional regulator
MVDVAREAGVSQKTVSRVINDAPHVRPELRRRVLAAIDQLGYRPNVAARALASQRTHVVGVLAVGLPLFGPAAQVFNLEHAARARGYEIALASLPDLSSSYLRAAVAGLLARGVEGVVLELPNHLVDIDESVFAGVPVATSVGRIPGIRRQTVVDTHQVEMGRRATDHLLALGHETVFHVSGPVDWEASRQRREGWSLALSAAGRPEPEVLHGDWSARSGYQLGRVLAARPDVTAIFSANDAQAMGVMRALAESGRSIPGDVSVVGIDDVPEAEFQMVPLTTLRNDAKVIAEQVLSQLVDLIEGLDPVPPAVPISSELVVRASSGPPPDRSRPPGVALPESRAPR